MSAESWTKGDEDWRGFARKIVREAYRDAGWADGHLEKTTGPDAPTKLQRIVDYLMKDNIQKITRLQVFDMMDMLRAQDNKTE